MRVICKAECLLWELCQHDGPGGTEGEGGTTELMLGVRGVEGGKKGGKRGGMGGSGRMDTRRRNFTPHSAHSASHSMETLPPQTQPAF